MDRQETLLEEMVFNTKVIVDGMDLFTWGECLLRFQEMGRPEGLEEAELVVRRHRSMGKGKGKGKEPERNPEVVPEVVPEGVPEVVLEVSMDVEMILQ